MNKEMREIVNAKCARNAPATMKHAARDLAQFNAEILVLAQMAAKRQRQRERTFFLVASGR